MNVRRLRAPSSDGVLLSEPPLRDAAVRLTREGERLDAWDYDFQGRRADSLRAAVRAQVIEAANAFGHRLGLDVPTVDPSDVGRLAVTGHQPELFHPGVWVKNFAASRLAALAGGTALNLIVDNDTPKSSELRVPHSAGGRLTVGRVAFDDWQGEVPYEDLTVADEALFASFGARVKERLGAAVADPLIETYWPKAVASAARTDCAGLRFSAARHGLEAAWGVKNLEVPLSAVCQTEGFLWFACHLLAQLPRFQQVHNEALAEYRSLHGIRSRHHPVPALTGEADWLEAPFWVWRASNPRRRPLLARQKARTLELRIAGENQPFAEIPLSADREACCAVEQLAELPGQGVRLRTRALTTTMFARYLLGDLFVHGIGGMKYDELGDEVARRFFRFEPPAYLTLSMTLWLGLPDEPAAAQRFYASGRKLRDLSFNPDRFVDSSSGPEVAELLQVRSSAISLPVETHAQRVARFREIRYANDGLQEFVARAREQADAERSRAASDLKQNAVARSREYSLVLHSERKLRAAFQGALTGVLDPPPA